MKNPKKSEPRPVAKGESGHERNTESDDVRAIQSYHEKHQSLGETKSPSCAVCRANQEFNDFAPVSEIDGELDLL